MNPGGLSRRIVLETLVDLLDDRLKAAPDGSAPQNARLVVFPKRTHELVLHEGQAPDGLGPAYVRLAAELNKAAAHAQSATTQTGATAADRLLRSIEQVVATATVHERALVALLQTP